MSAATRFAEACQHPFANGTESHAWQSAWCDHCARDHQMHGPDGAGPGCDLLMTVLLEEWPEGWIPEPDDGHYYLPSRLCCTAFTPCEPCGGDPGAEERAARLAEVTTYWKARS